MVVAFCNDNQQVFTGNDYEPNCYATCVHVRNPYSHRSYNVEGVHANILMSECITGNNKYSSLYIIGA